MKRIVPLLIVALSLTAFAKKKEFPAAPLPAAVTNAKTVFLVNGGGSSLAFDAFYAAMKDWGKYQIVGSPEAADLVITLNYWVEKNGSSAVPVTNTYTGQTTYYSSENRDPQNEADNCRRQNESGIVVFNQSSEIGCSLERRQGNCKDRP
jgi:hypothetical protein